MTQSLKRCENVYGKTNCELIQYSTIVNKEIEGISPSAVIPYVSRKCPESYKRHGCCKCLRNCNENSSAPETLDTKDIHNFCIKKESYESNAVTEISDEDSHRWEPFGDSFIERCFDGYIRVGAKLCVASCPLGWPDLGDRCMKTNDII